MKNWKLEFIRGVAALLVFICHFVSINPALRSNKNLYLFSQWGTESVIIFFVLSGLVINIVQKKKNSTRKEFITNRLLRIYPQYIAGLLLAIVAGNITGNTINLQTILGAFCFTSTLEGHITQVPSTNPVIWSLSYEIFFYLIYSLTIGKWQQKLLYAWCIISLCCIPAFYFLQQGVIAHIVSMFAFSSIWLLGYYVYEFRNKLRVQGIKISLLFTSLLPAVSRLQLTVAYYDVGKYFLFAILSVPVFVYCVQNNSGSKQGTSIKISLVHALVSMPLVFAGLFFFGHSRGIANMLYISIPLAAFIYALIPGFILRPNLLLKQAAYFGGLISYSIYIIHYPILLLIYFYTGTHFIVYAAISLPLVLVLSYLMETKYQQFFNKLFSKKNK